MAWTIEFLPRANRELERLGTVEARRIRAFLADRLAKMDDPRMLGQALQGPQYGDFWRYRVGDYRLICKIEYDRVVILVVTIGNRRDVYK